MKTLYSPYSLNAFTNPSQALLIFPLPMSCCVGMTNSVDFPMSLGPFASHSAKQAQIIVLCFSCCAVSPDAIHEHVKTKQLEHKSRLHYTAPEYAGIVSLFSQCFLLAEYAGIVSLFSLNACYCICWLHLRKFQLQSCN